MAHILLIEPDTTLSQIYAASLSWAGHDVRQATTAQTGIDVADQAPLDLVLLELQLVAHSGVEFLYEFRSYPEWQTVPVVILSRVPPAEFKGSAELLKTQLGVEAYYYKPNINLVRLSRIIDIAVPRAV